MSDSECGRLSRARSGAGDKSTKRNVEASVSPVRADVEYDLAALSGNKDPNNSKNPF